VSGCIFTIIFFTVFILLFCFIIYTFIKDKAKMEKIYADFILREGFRDIINSSMEKNEFIQKAINVANKYSDYSRITPNKLIMKKEDARTLYLSSATFTERRSSPGSGTILLITLPVNIEGVFIIRSRLSNIIETLISGIIESKGLIPLKSVQLPEDKFIAYTSTMKNKNFLTPPIREVIENYSTIPMGENNMVPLKMTAVIIITDNVLYISGIRTSNYVDIRGILELGRELSSAILKSLSDGEIYALTDSEEKLCPSCGEKYPGNNKFCTNCGNEKA
jgi:hypothetical protein